MLSATRCAQAVFAGRDEDEVDVIIHQAPGEAARMMRIASPGHQFEIATTIIVAEEDRQPPVAPLRHMVRHIRDDNASKARHLKSSGASPDARQLV